MVYLFLEYTRSNLSKLKCVSVHRWFDLVGCFYRWFHLLFFTEYYFLIFTFKIQTINHKLLIVYNIFIYWEQLR